MTIKFDRKIIDKNVISWHNISWRFVDMDVKRLRSRIFIARRENNLKKVISLQKLMINSASNTLIAIRRVTQSTGAKTPGLDKQLYLSPKDKIKLFHEIRELNFRKWNPPPVKRTYIPKPDGRKRPLGIPTIKDRALQAIVMNALEPEWEAVFESTSYGFRPGRSYQDIATRLHTMLKNKDRIWIVDGDISNCFCEISHEYLINKISHFPYSDLISRWLKAGAIDNGIFEETEAGTPQGGVISPLLCNITLHGIEKELGIRHDSQGIISRKMNKKIHRTILRYADDFLVICPTYDIAQFTLKDVGKSLKLRGLEISEAKTQIVTTYEGFDFVGFHFRHYFKQGYEHVNLGNITNGIESSKRKFVSTIIEPSNKSLKNIKLKIRMIFRKGRSYPLVKIILQLNRLIIGYCESKRTVNFSRTARKLNHYLYEQQMLWAKRLHPQKGKKWIVNKYFVHLKNDYINNRWVFRDPSTNTYCYQFIWFCQKRNWPQIKAQYCPDDPNPIIQEYFKIRSKKLFENKVVNMINNFDYSIAKSQDFMCVVCGQPLCENGKLHRHHIIPISQGGKNYATNIVIIHQHCHNHIHYGEKLDYWIKTLQDYKRTISSKITKSEFKTLEKHTIEYL